MDPLPEFTPHLASHIAGMVLAGVHREYPNKLDHVLNGAESVQPPRTLHPAFYGCFDWHSAVHGHWVLARLLRLMPGLPEAGAMRAAMRRSLTPENIAVETAYLARPNSGSFERMYGWAWLLKLAEELSRLDTDDGRAWSAALAPLADAFVGRYLAYLPKVDYPMRTGVHSNTAFGLAFAHDFAVSAGRADLRNEVERTALRLFGADRDYPAWLEPGGADFFSAALMEAELMRRVVPADQFGPWLRGFLPGLSAGEPRSLLAPARVSDRADLQIVHLDGLNLSRAWCLRSLAGAVDDAVVKGVMLGAARVHLEAGLAGLTGGTYAGDHWLGTFAVLAMTGG